MNIVGIDIGGTFTDLVGCVDGRIVTGQAPGAALAFALAVLGVLKGEAIVKQVADGLVARTV